jgi:hypothetical protein
MKLSTIGYVDALSAVEEAAVKGVGVYEMAIAFELDYAISIKKKSFGRRKKLIEKIESDAPMLFDAAMDTFRKSAGGCTPFDAAQGIVDAYLKCGMDVGRARAYASISDFAVGN